MEIILYKYEIPINEITSIIKNNNFEIFVFDYESHLKLKQNNIKHNFSDDLLQNKDYDFIQEKSIYFTKWFMNEKIRNEITFKEVNLGSLNQVEFHYELVSKIKKIVEIKKICTKHSNDKIFASNELYEISKLFFENVEKIKTEKDKDIKFLYDYVKIPLINDKVVISISKKRYHIIKNSINKIFLNLQKLRKDDKSKEKIVFFEFDPVKYNLLFQTLSKKYSTIMYNRRRPYFWNWKSLLNLMSSKTKIVNEENYISSNIFNDINKNVEKIQDKLENLVEKYIFFENYFSIEGISFWKIIKKEFTILHSKRFHDAIYEITLCEKFFKENKIKKIVVWSENSFNEKIAIDLAKKFNIRVYLIQHGLYFETIEAIYYNQFNGVMPFLSDVFLGWGNPTVEYMKNTIKNKEMIPVGNVNFDQILKNHRRYENDGYILLVTTSPVKNIASDLKIESMISYVKTIKEICNIANKLNKKLIIKIHPDIDNFDLSKIIQTSTNIQIKKYENIIPLIRSCDLMISIDLSTTILEAQLFQKPVIIIKVKDQRLGTPEIFRNNGYEVINVNELEKELKNIKDQKYKKKIISIGIEFLKKYVIQIGNSSTNILKVLEKN